MSSYHVPGFVLGAGETAVKKADPVLDLRLPFQCGRQGTGNTWTLLSWVNRLNREDYIDFKHMAY